MQLPFMTVTEWVLADGLTICDFKANEFEVAKRSDEIDLEFATEHIQHAANAIEIEPNPVTFSSPEATPTSIRENTTSRNHPCILPHL